MNKIALCMILITMLACLYAQENRPVSFDNKEKLLKLITTLPLFKPDETRVSFLEHNALPQYLQAFPQDKVQSILKGFGKAVLFTTKRHFLALSRWKDEETANQFMQLEKEFLALKDKQFASNFKTVVYSEITIGGNKEIAWVGKKVVKQGEKDYNVISFVTTRNRYMLEGFFTEGDKEEEKLKDFLEKDDKLQDFIEKFWEKAQVSASSKQG